MMVNGNRGLGGWAGPFPGYACLLSLLVRREWGGGAADAWSRGDPSFKLLSTDIFTFIMMY